MARRNKPPKAQKRITKIGFWSMIRDVLIASMNKGQLLPATLALVAIILICKMPSGRAGDLVFALLDSTRSWGLLGYILWLLTLYAAWRILKRQRQLIAAEMERMGREKSRLQAQLLERNLKSSDK